MSKDKTHPVILVVFLLLVGFSCGAFVKEWIHTCDLTPERTQSQDPLARIAAIDSQVFAHEMAIREVRDALVTRDGNRYGVDNEVQSHHWQIIDLLRERKTLLKGRNK